MTNYYQLEFSWYAFIKGFPFPQNFPQLSFNYASKQNTNFIKIVSIKLNEARIDVGSQFQF